ncbi:Sugar kinase of the NBD/HSP70 family, may contain an N-terminal HTH domain [Dyella sp. OK004]|uniref:ROK family protein n=1 Tax=Dyella sp. OK004 TaxID=1855292 RepID=UPI0008EF38BC|nr:ROK family protein [Dyella sp. OK004]SFR86268.1 Sugar kinase of the NBD/HSP70 family, may contain an N-terminal HTH domain [Dyella sp. OK004]
MPMSSKSNKPTTGTNLEHARLHNRRVVLEAIRQAGRLTRADLTRLTSLTAQTISNIVAELIAESKLSAHAPEKIARGQPPIPLSINPDGGFSIGFHVEQHQIVAVLLDLKGVTRGRRVHAVSYPTFAEALPLLLKCIDAFRRKVSAERLLGIGIALPGPFGVEGMSAVGPTSMPGWDDEQSLAVLRQKTGLPVLMENDATAAAMGERLYGVAGGMRDFAYLFVGHGLGSGFYLDNRLYSGHWRNAGEIGHVIVTPNGKPCYCGKRGCLERYVSGASLLEHLGVGADQNLSDLDLTDRKHTAGIQRWLAEAVPALRHAVSVLESLLDPETVLIGGTLSNDILGRLIEQSPPLFPSVSVRANRAHARLQLGTAGPDCVALGAAALVVLAELSPDYQALLKA